MKSVAAVFGTSLSCNIDHVATRSVAREMLACISLRVTTCKRCRVTTIVRAIREGTRGRDLVVRGISHCFA